MEIIVNKLSYTYSPNAPFATQALRNISLKIDEGEFLGIIGKTGSGKSTFVLHLNGLLKAQNGEIYYDKEDIYDKKYDLSSLRKRVGLVFQYPEYQLFETTVLEDVKFGPKNQGLSDKEAGIRAYEALEALSFPRELALQSPFELSGGQKRLAAIAGVLAMKPDVLILDEPTAALDPRGRRDILKTLKKLHEDTKKTIILVSHSMEDVANYVNRILVMDSGSILMDGTPRDVFSQIDTLESVGLKAPEMVYLLRELKNNGINVNEKVINVAEAVEEIKKALLG